MINVNDVFLTCPFCFIENEQNNMKLWKRKKKLNDEDFITNTN
jgi:hypothetical protein